MGLAGNLRNLHLLEVLRIINLGRSTGSLMIRSPKGVGIVNFHLGEIIYAGVEDHPVRVGELLVQKGHLTKESLQKILLAQHQTKPWKPIGTIAIELGLTTVDKLRETICEMITSLIDEMASWKSGIFRFEQGKVSVSDEITLDMRELLLRSSGQSAISVDQFFDGGSLEPVTVRPPEPEDQDFSEVDGLDEEVGLDTEIASDKKAGLSEEAGLDAEFEPEEEVDLGAEVDLDPEAGAEANDGNMDGLVEEFFGSHPFREEKENQSIFRIYKEGARLKEMLSTLGEERSHGEISLLMLRYASEFLDRVILFFIRRQDIVGLGHCGLSDDPAAMDKSVRSLKLSLDDKFFSQVVSEQTAFRGELPNTFWKNNLQGILGLPKPKESAILPVPILNQVRLILYGDNLLRGIDKDLSNLELFTQQVGMAFEIALLSRKKKKSRD